jgi:hypothetical protein
MTIRILTNIKETEYEKILAFYNKYRPETAKPLEILECAEGGFKIEVDYVTPNIDYNKNIRQLRWFNQRLVKYGLFDSFTNDEEILLFKALSNVLGKNNMEWE